MRTLAILPFAFATLLAAGGPVAAHHALKDFEEALRRREYYLELAGRPAPGFSLRDADGRALGLDDLKGRVVVLNFVFATCTDVCPLHSAVIAEVQERVNARVGTDGVQFVTITTHPEIDTPASLRAYGSAHGLDARNWVFLTSGPERPTETRALAERYGLKFTPLGNGQFVHGVVTHLIDREGVLRARYHGLRFDPETLVDHIKVLAAEVH